MIDPRSALSRLREIGRRRPRLVALVGLGLVAEAGRVAWGIARGGPVALLGHSGIERLDGDADRIWLVAYAGWVLLCGAVIVATVAADAIARRRAAARASGVGGRSRPEPTAVIRRRIRTR